VDAFAQGNYQAVLGEMHVATNTLSASFWQAQHPHPDVLQNAMDVDIPEPLLVYDIPKSWPSVTSRTQSDLEPHGTYHLIFGPDPPTTPRSRSLPVGATVIKREGEDLILSTRDGLLRFDFLEAVSSMLNYLTGFLIDRFRILPEGPHSPRVTIDNLVIARETWSVRADDLAFAWSKDEVARLVATRSWARDLGLPRFVFVRVPTEQKPFYVDFESPMYVGTLAKMVRRQRGSGDLPLTVTEMLPTPEQVWLPDAEGRRYTSELRIVAVDLAHTNQV